MKKTTIVLVLCFLCVSFGYSQKRYLVTAKNGLNIREQPNVNSKKIGKLPFSTAIRAIEVKTKRTEHIVDSKDTLYAKWFKIKLNQSQQKTSNNKYGYLFGAYLKRDNGNFIHPHLMSSRYNNSKLLKEEVLKLTKITREQFDSTNINKSPILTEIEKDKYHFFIKTKYEKFKFEKLREDTSPFLRMLDNKRSFYGAEYIGYYPELKIYEIKSYKTQLYRAMEYRILIDSITGYEYSIYAFDYDDKSSIKKPLFSIKNDYLIYHKNFDDKEEISAYIIVLKINKLERESPKKFLINYKCYFSKDWKIDEIRFIDNDNLAIKTYKERTVNQEVIKNFYYFKASLK